MHVALVHRGLQWLYSTSSFGSRRLELNHFILQWYDNGTLIHTVAAEKDAHLETRASGLKRFKPV
jgi:hypothetical protein